MNASESPLTADALLREGAALRALARRLLDDAAADDVVQDTYVAALRGSAPHGAVGAWLTAIARRLAALTRRRDARRLTRELHIAARTGPAPSAADAAATAEWMQRVAAAVAELPEAQRTVVVLRFWHDLTPRAIAARLHEPLNTVSSRLHRALVLLRERLDAHGDARGAWIAPLAAFAGSTTVATKANVAVAAAATAAIAWLVWPAERAASLPPASPDLPAARTVAANDAPPRREPAAAATSTVSGRCLTEDGAPVAGCQVGLASTPGGGERSQPQMKSADASGRFEFAPVPAAEPATMACFAVHLVAVECEWQALPPGAVDLGDIRLPAGAQLVGMVRDAGGEGVGGVMLDLELISAKARVGGFVPFARRPVQSRADGVLEPFGGALAVGTWRVHVRSPDYVLRSAADFTVVPQQGKVELDVRVARLDEQPSITGTVCDERGAPVARVTLYTNDGSSAETGADGAFTMRRRGAAHAPVRFTIATQEQHSLAAPDAAYAWGSTGHRIVVRRPAGVWLHVVHADTGEPVTDYGVWLVPEARDEWSQGLRDNGHHEHGRLQLTNVRAGRYRVIVHPADTTLMPSEALDTDLAGDIALRVEVERARALTVDVRTAAGDPVAGSTVDLFRREGDGELQPGMIGGPDRVYRTFKTTTAFPVLASARTDASGRAVLPAPRRGRLGLRVQGAHVPSIEHPLRAVADDEPIVLTVLRGATLRGTLSPSKLLRELAPSADAPHGVAMSDALDLEPAASARPWPTVQLREVGGSRRVLPVRVTMTQPAHSVGDDGTFCFAGIPNGDWQVELQCGIGDAWYSHLLGTVNALADGEQRSVAFDIAELAPAELRATVLLDGVPAASGKVRFGSGWFATDRRGRVVAKVLPGKHRFMLGSPAADSAAGVYADEPIVLRPGEVVERTVELTRRRLSLRVLRADGSPAAEQVFGITWVGDLRTDGKGLLVLDPAPSWELTLHPPTEDVMVGRQKNRILGGPVRMPLDRREAIVEVRLVE